MPSISLVFPNGSKEEFPLGITGNEIIQKAVPRLSKEALAIQLDSEILELNRPLKKGGNFKILTWKDEDGKKAFWHTASHVLAEAVAAVFPKALPTLGPPIDEGFYYDFDVSKPFLEEDLAKIEQKMKEIVSRNERLLRQELSKKDALKKFGSNKYKKELIEEFAKEGEAISLYSQGKFFDLCRGGHVEETGKIKAFKLLKTSGAYWRGSEKNKMLQRIYGIAFPEQKLLDEYLKKKDEAEKNSHLVLGKELDLFAFSPLVGKGLPLWTPNGSWIRFKLEEFLREEQFWRGYEFVVTPHLGNKKLFETSGHYPYYKETMYAPVQIEDEEYLLRPMNCPFHIQVFASQRRSYREMPLRLAEFGTVYRFEKSGELIGLLRVRGLTQDDAHLFVTPEQLKEEFFGIFDFIVKILETVGLKEFQVRLGTRDPENPKYVGSLENWKKAQEEIESALKEKKIPYRLDIGEAAFYGPKADIIIKDTLGREWQLGTIQVDYNLPERFDLNYIGSDDKPHRPIMIHRAPVGSMERFTAILIEHFKGAFPPWLSPHPVRVLPLADRHNEYAFEIRKKLRESKIRAEVDASANTLSYKVRQGQLEKVPIVIVVGDREEKEKTVTIRLRSGKQIPNYKLQKFLEKTLEIIEKRQLEFSY